MLIDSYNYFLDKRMLTRDKSLGRTQQHFIVILYNGVDIKTVQEILGHEDIQTTLDIYTHVLSEMKREGQKAIYKAITICEVQLLCMTVLITNTICICYFFVFLCKEMHFIVAIKRFEVVYYS